jgi:hypothetical protein
LDPRLPAKPAFTPTPSVTPISTPMITPVPTPTPTKMPVATPKPWLPISGFEVILWLFAVAFAVVISYLNTFKRRK